MVSDIACPPDNVSLEVVSVCSLIKGCSSFCPAGGERSRRGYNGLKWVRHVCLGVGGIRICVYRFGAEMKKSVEECGTMEWRERGAVESSHSMVLDIRHGRCVPCHM